MLKGKSIEEIEKIADFYMVDLSDLFNDPVNTIKSSTIKLNHKKVSKTDFNSISKFGRIVKIYLKMIELDPVEKRDRKINSLLLP